MALIVAAVVIGLIVIIGIFFYLKCKKKSSDQSANSDPTHTSPSSVQQQTKGNETEPQTETEIPQDSTLRRHHMTLNCTQTECTHTPAPTDSTLLRHYTALIEQ